VWRRLLLSFINPNTMMRKNISFTVLLFIAGFTLNAQDPLDPGWLWAVSGGSSASLIGAESPDYHNERVVDIAVDGENNYYLKFRSI
jgi:hypothetical protein